jgi:hypothetical protein
LSLILISSLVNKVSAWLGLVSKKWDRVIITDSMSNMLGHLGTKSDPSQNAEFFSVEIFNSAFAQRPFYLSFILINILANVVPVPLS